LKRRPPFFDTHTKSRLPHRTKERPMPHKRFSYSFRPPFYEYLTGNLLYPQRKPKSVPSMVSHRFWCRLFYAVGLVLAIIIARSTCCHHTETTNPVWFQRLSPQFRESGVHPAREHQRLVSG
jgi:hypothetical protein